jgi:hypothetical protein
MSINQTFEPPQCTPLHQPVFSADSHEGHPVDGVEEPTPCIQRWVNIADESTKK